MAKKSPATTPEDGLIPVVPEEPLTSVQSQIGLLLTAIATVIAFIFHKDFSPLVPAITTLSFTIYGGAIAIARAWKHNTVVNANLALHSMQQDVPARAQVQNAFDAVGAHIADVEAKVDALQEAQKAPRKATTPRARARGTSGTSRTATAR